MCIIRNANCLVVYEIVNPGIESSYKAIASSTDLDRPVQLCPVACCSDAFTGRRALQAGLSASVIYWIEVGW